MPELSPASGGGGTTTGPSLQKAFGDLRKRGYLAKGFVDMDRIFPLPHKIRKAADGRIFLSWHCSEEHTESTLGETVMFFQSPYF